jgi:hypothetical protein
MSEKVFVHSGKKYREVSRIAGIGEKVVIVKGLGWYKGKEGEVYEVISGKKYGFNPAPSEYGALYVENGQNENGCCSFVSLGTYRVLEPLKSEESPDITDLLANLANRVHSLEQQLRDTQRNLETFAEQTENNTKDIAMLDERTQPQSAEVVTFEKFLDSIADKVAERLVGQSRTEVGR